MADAPAVRALKAYAAELLSSTDARDTAAAGYVLVAIDRVKAEETSKTEQTAEDIVDLIFPPESGHRMGNTVNVYTTQIDEYQRTALVEHISDKIQSV